MLEYLATNDQAHRSEARETLADNYTRMYEYGKAADEYKTLAVEFGMKVGKKKTDDYQNSYRMFDALRKTPRQQLVLNGDLRVQGKRDMAGMLNLPVEIDGQPIDFVFDTGAELSVVTASTAKKLNLQMIDSEYSVSTSTDIVIKSKLAVAPVMKFGNATFTNVVFLVLEDKALYFPPVKYQINAIVGFPVMEELGNVTISRENEVSSNRSRELEDIAPNMFLEGLKPIVQASVFGKQMIFAFDTGGVTSTFYPKFFEANKRYILGYAKLQKRKAGGAGGMKSVMAYMLKGLNMTISERIVRLPVAEIYPRPLNEESRNYYGNLGQDIIKQFERMTLDFRAMRLIFE